MAGTTSNYLFPYPTGSDLARNGATAIQGLADSIDSFISGSAALNKLFNVYDTMVSTSSTTSATSPAVIPTNPNSTSFTTGKSGVFMVICQARLAHNTTNTLCSISPDITGALTSASSALRMGAVTSGAANTGGTVTWIGVFDGAASTPSVCNLHAWSAAGATMTVTWSRVTIVTLG